MKSKKVKKTKKTKTYKKETTKCAVFLLVSAIICFVAYLIIPAYPYAQQDGTILFENPESFCTSLNGWNAVADDKDTIFCMDDYGNFAYTIHIDEFLYKDAEIIDILFGEDNKLYCHIAVYREDAFLTEMESVWEINADGDITREVIHYNYQKSDNQPSRQIKMQGLHFNDNKLIYLYEEEGGNNIVEINLDSPQQGSCVWVAREGFAEIMECHGMLNGDFLVLKNNGEIGIISLDGKYESIYKATYDPRKKEGLFPYDVLVLENKLYMLAGQDELALYEWSGGDWNNEKANDVSSNKWCKLADIREAAGLSDDINLYTYGLGEYEGKPGVNVNEKLFILENGDEFTECSSEYALSTLITVCITVKECLLLIGIICLIVGTVYGIGNMMKWRFSLLSKQIFSIVPIVCILLVVVIIIMFISMVDLSGTDIIKEAIAVNEIAASQFDANELEDILGYESIDNGKVCELNNRLREFVNGNKSDWSRNYHIVVGIRITGERFVIVAGSDETKGFMTSGISTETPIHHNFYEGSNTFAADASYGEDRKNLHLVLMTPIYHEDGSYDAVMVLFASQDRLIDEFVTTGKRLLINVLLWGAVLVFVITLVSARNVRSLRHAKDVIAQIAGGDFSVRVEKYSKDEVGEICVGVNDMADRLEEYFDELRRNEKFYYKFVPEKFRELLHKDKFTDLALGDARSEDLSILFCDIRAFSMNSEMMTAKESFDFVNKIYGKAGPIVRKHKGFIDKYIGDAVMALFESADDAVRAGIELYRAIVFCENPLDEFGISFVKVGVGIHSGMARIGIVGEEERMS